MSPAGGGGLSADVVFGLRPWEEEVERYHRLSPPRIRAQNARKMIDAGDRKLDWLNCRPDGRIPLPGCRKLYVPLGKQAPSEAPYGFVFMLVQRRDSSLLGRSLPLARDIRPIRRPAPSTSAPTSASTAAIRVSSMSAGSERSGPNKDVRRQPGA